MRASILFAFLAGALFALGLIVSQMVNPQKVLSFLDLAGAWDPTLALVFAGALSVALPGVQLVLRRRAAPVLDNAWQLPPTRQIDVSLIGGAALFGIGWGLAGLCPGPAVTALASGSGKVFAFGAAMATGIVLYKLAFEWRGRKEDG